MIGLVNGNAARIPLRDESVHCVVTSPPYWGLRSYSGLEPVEWPEVTYTPMPGLAPVTVAGCDPECEHVWGDEQFVATGNAPSINSTLTTNAGQGPMAGDKYHHTQSKQASQGQFCQLCGGWRSHLGLEPTPEMYVAHLVAVMREVRRVMRDDAVLFLNLGDSYCTRSVRRSDGKRTVIKNFEGNAILPSWSEYAMTGNARYSSHLKAVGLKDKDLMGIPWRVAFALQADGWWLRSDVVWAKGLSFCDEYSGSAMPESVNGWRWSRCRVKISSGDRGKEDQRIGAYPDRPQQDHNGKDFAPSAVWSDCPGCPKCADTGGYVLRRGSWRPTKTHEMVFMLTKSDSYFCDREAVKEKGSGRSAGNKKYKYDGVPGFETKQGILSVSDKEWTSRNLRSVWTLPTSQYPGQHYAVYPEKLPEVCIRAATSEAGVCAECGAQLVRKVETGFTAHDGKTETKHDINISTAGRLALLRQAARERGGEYGNATQTLGFRPSCSCDAPAVPATVLDPFIGSGTTALVARELGRDCVALDLSSEYLRDQARPRLELDRLSAWDGDGKDGTGEPLGALPLFAGLKP